MCALGNFEEVASFLVRTGVYLHYLVPEFFLCFLFLCCCLVFVSLCAQGNFEEVASFLVDNGADPNDVYTDDKGKEHNLLFDSVTLGNEVKANAPFFFFFCLDFDFRRSYSRACIRAQVIQGPKAWTRLELYGWSRNHYKLGAGQLSALKRVRRFLNRLKMLRLKS